MKKILLYVVVMLFLTAGISVAADDEESWLTIGGDLRVRYDNLEGTVHDHVTFDNAGAFISAPGYKVSNDALFLGRFGLDVKARATENISVMARMLMYKVWGHETVQPVQGNYFADRAYGPFDGTVSHVPGDNSLRWDHAYATWTNIAGLPIWFSAGRKPSTGGAPTNIRQNLEITGVEGFTGIVMDYAFDGLSLGYSPNMDIAPGAYAKISYGKGFDSGYVSDNSVQAQYDLQNTLKDTDFVGLNVVPYAADNLHINLQAQKAFHVTEQSTNDLRVLNPDSQGIVVKDNLGDISWWGGVVMGKVFGFNLFASMAQSETDPNSAFIQKNNLGYGLLWDTFHPASKKKLVGTAIYVGGRYDFTSTGTKIGAEYNEGSKFWIGLVPAADDIWTSKLGTRGKVYEVYVIQELNKEPISKRGKAFCRVGYQYYKFDYTGSNSWMGAPIKISALDLNNSGNVQILAPLEDAKDLYVTLDVLF